MFMWLGNRHGRVLCMRQAAVGGGLRAGGDPLAGAEARWQRQRRRCRGCVWRLACSVRSPAECSCSAPALRASSLQPWTTFGSTLGLRRTQTETQTSLQMQSEGSTRRARARIRACASPCGGAVPLLVPQRSIAHHRQTRLPGLSPLLPRPFPLISPLRPPLSPSTCPCSKEALKSKVSNGRWYFLVVCCLQASGVGWGGGLRVWACRGRAARMPHGRCR